MNPPQPSPEKIYDLLRSYWGFSSFRPLQKEIIFSVLGGKDTLAIMPTGGGKSLCYQIPALAKEGCCLVVSPLIALMKDQVRNLRKKQVTALAIFSGMSRREVLNTLRVAGNSNCRFLYVSPERLETPLFREFLPGLGISLLAVDEAHCISQWGYDFRPSYLRIADIRGELPGVPVLALTASATREVQQDICERLGFSEQNIFRQSFARPNLSYSAFRKPARINKILEILQNVNGAAIVYCRSRKRTKEIAELLRLRNISADAYHAGLDMAVRTQRQEDWLANKTRVIVCTNAFGMGIDKSDVRAVIHADLPDCLESYYQEAGRAGRDGQRSYAVLLYDDGDIRELETLEQSRYPGIEEIRSVYQAVANYLQIPAGSANGACHDFDLADFVRKFRIPAPTVVHSLKALEQDGWLSFNEQVFRPSLLQFTTDKHYLYQFEAMQPELEPLIKTLLRAYEGIFDQPVIISETVVAGLMKRDVIEIKEQLQRLLQQGIVDYIPQKEGPQLQLLRSRVPAQELRIDLAAYEERKSRFRARSRKMIEYTAEEHHCRSRMIGKYFGDEDLADCGICDNCLRKKRSVLSREEFEKLNARIMESVRKEPLHTRELLGRLSGVRREKAWKVLEFLQAENKIEMDANGYVRLK